MSEGQKIAAWITFAAIGGGMLNAHFNWLYCLVLNAAIEGKRFETDPLRSIALGAIGCTTVIGSSCLWQLKRRWSAAFSFGVGCAALLVAMP